MTLQIAQVAEFLLARCTLVAVRCVHVVCQLLPIIEHLGTNDAVQLILVWLSIPLAGLFPVTSFCGFGCPDSSLQVNESTG